mmetsp:Transcript_43283/g.112475  ORF Transcript_43283/g.112475 Transcript_43283/m.112475 type:complete len:436 (+) Transcript_43283:269-1576(+)
MEEGLTFLKDSGVKEHIEEILLKAIEQRPDDLSSTLEYLSLAVKEGKTVHTIPSEAAAAAATAAAAPFAVKIPAEGEEPEEVPDVADKMDNLFEDLKALEWAGVNISEGEILRLTSSVQKLAATDGVKKVRLFGKIEGTQKNYYIAETRFEEGKRPKAGGEEEEEKGEEEKKEGQIAAEGEGEGPYVESTNYYVYYASNSPDGPWVQLPDVSHDMIIAARKMKKFFTGDLNTPVIVNPPFPTTVKRAAGDKRVHRAAESDLLRAQLARIAHTTTLCRQKYFKLAGEEEEESEEKEEGASEVVIEDVNEVLPPVDANQVEFMHMHSDILKQGGCKFVGAPEEGEEEEAEAEGEEGEEKKPKKKIVVEKNQPKLAPIKSDGKVHGKEAWSVRVCNGNIPECAVAVARSNLWAGAVTVSSPYKLVNFYSGYGIKSDAK